MSFDLLLCVFDLLFFLLSVYLLLICEEGLEVGKGS